MQRSSESIASLAAALAKAQTELVNPEKLLIGTIPAENDSGAERAFRYASLASGLDIVRKILGEHEIATIQTTAIDQEAGIVNLTTTLAHSSGEWIASDWPVCAISETSTPHRMGAALTYARRYALFTLVGIAGEDDLDAPDLATPPKDRVAPAKPKERGNGRRNGHGSERRPIGRTAFRKHIKALLDKAKPVLEPQASAAVRDRLVAEIADLASEDEAALWARRWLPEKNRLTAADAQLVEQAFQAKLAAVAAPDGDARDAPRRTGQPMRSRNAHPRSRGKQRGADGEKQPRTNGIDKSVLAFPEPRRIRDRDHVRFVARQPCLVCGRQPSDPHHVRFAQSPALGRKVSDEFTVPLCRGHHREVHHCGDELVWWLKVRINPMVAARALWLKTHPLPADPANSRIEATEPTTPA